jgi:O-antigen/teichoic acid export membrane protein
MPERSTGQIRKTAKHSAINAVGMMLRRITGLVMLPIYTRYLNPADYGAVELLTMAIELAGILIRMRISQAMFRYYILTETEEEKHVVVSTVLLTL